MATGTDQAVGSHQVLLTGASSQIGVFALPRLVQAGFQVIAVSRNGRPAAFPAFEQVRWLREAEAIEAAKDCRYLVSAGPLELARQLMHTLEWLEKAVVFSSSSVESKRDSGYRAEKDQMRDMLSLESELRSIAGKGSLQLVLFRPTLIYGCGLDANISRLAYWIRRLGFLPVNGAAEGLRQPVHADDLAMAAISALRSDKSLPEILYLCGGDTLSYSQMVSRIFAALGRPARLLRLPQWLFVSAITIAGAFKPASGLNGEMVKRQRLDLVFDDSLARQLLGFEPRGFKPVEADFHLPGFE